MAVVLLTLKHLENLPTQCAIEKYKEGLGGDACVDFLTCKQSACVKEHKIGQRPPCVCFITAGPITKLFAGGGGGGGRTCAMIYAEPRPVWMSPLITH